MIRDWLAICFLGSLSLFFGNLWLCKELLMLAATCQFIILPSYTAGILYIKYNFNIIGNVLSTWWLACLIIFQFGVGLMCIYLYAWLKLDLETRDREEEIKCDMGKISFQREAFNVTAMPCAHKLWDDKMDEVLKRYNNIHQVEVRANILCPIC